MSELAAALAKLQADLPRITKRAKAQHGKYADYPSIKAKVDPKLREHGWVWWTQPEIKLFTTESEWRFVLTYTLEHLASGESVTGWYPLNITSPQAQGSEISYAKRYALCAVLDIAPEGEDDDGMAASRPRSRVRIDTEHERLANSIERQQPDDRPAERITPGDNPVDKWTDQPPGDFDIGTPEDRPGSIDRRQEKLMHQAFNRIGITDRAVRLGMTEEIIGRQVMTSKQLSALEADHLIKALGAKAEEASR